MFTRRNLWGLAALLPALSLPKLAEAEPDPSEAGAAMRFAEKWAKHHVEAMCDGPITYSTTRLNSWGSEHNEYLVGYDPGRTYPDEPTGFISNWKIHRTPLAAAEDLVNFYYLTKGANYTALEWRQTPEMAQYSLPEHNKDGTIARHTYHYRAYMRLTSVRRFRY